MIRRIEYSHPDKMELSPQYSVRIAVPRTDDLPSRDRRWTTEAPAINRRTTDNRPTIKSWLPRSVNERERMLCNRSVSEEYYPVRFRFETNLVNFSQLPLRTE